MRLISRPAKVSSGARPMLDLDEVIARLSPLDCFLAVDGAMGTGEVHGVARIKPSAWVIPGEDKAGDNTQLSAVLQDVQAVFEVVYNVPSAGDAAGRNAHTALRQMRMDTFAALLGWTPTGMDTPIVHSKGALIWLGSGLLQWADRFATQYVLDFPLQD